MGAPVGHPVTWFEIGGDDVPALERFYAELFGWRTEPVPGIDYAIVDTGGVVGGGLTDGHGVTIYVEVDDLDGHLRRAEQLGGRCVVPVTEIPDMVTFAQFADPAGNTVGLVAGGAASSDDGASPRYVLFYDTSERAAELVPLHYPAHAARVDEFHARGELLAVGTFDDPMVDGSMAVFATREAAERFVDEDPFRTEGVVSAWRIKEWHTSVG